MSVRNNNGYAISTRVEDYYSDEDDGPPSSHHTPVPSLSSASPRQQQQQQLQKQQQQQQQQLSSPKYAKRNSIVNRNSRLRNSFNGRGLPPPQPPRGYYDHDEESDEEELRRAMYDFGLEDNPYGGYNSRPPSHRSSFDYFDPELADGPMFSPSQHVHSPGYFLPPPPPPPPPSRYMNEEEMEFGPYHYFVPPHLQERYAPPPPPPPPPPHWLHGAPYPMMEDMSPRMRPRLDNDLIIYSPQHQQPMDLPFVRRSASSRSYNRRNRPNQRLPSRRNQELFLSRDNDGVEANEIPPDFINDVNDPEEEEAFFRFQQQQHAFQQQQRPALSRQSSNGSTSSRKSNIPVRKRRANSLSAMPPHMMMMDNNPNYFIPPPPPPPHPQHHMNQPYLRNNDGGRRIHSEPSSPQHVSSDSSGSDDSEDEYYAPQPPQQQRNNGRRGSLRHGNPIPGGRPPMGAGSSRPLGRSLSFQGFPPHIAHPAPPPPPPQQPLPGALLPQMIVHPPPMPHPIMENTLRRNSSMFNLPTGGATGMGGDFFDPMMNSAQISPALQQQQHSLADMGNTNGSTTPASGNGGENNSNNGNQPQQQPQQQQQPNMVPPPPHWMGGLPPLGGHGLPNSPVTGMFNQQQQQPGMMQPMMPMGLPMFNNPMMGPPPPQQPIWNFMNPQDMWFGQPDFPLPFMNSSDPNLIAQTLGGGPPPPLPQQQQQKPQQGSPGGGGGNHENDENEMMRRSAPESEMMQQQQNDMMMPPQQQPQEPMLRRGLSLLGGLFGAGGGGKKGPPQYFNPPFGGNGEEFHPMGSGGFPPGNFSVPIQGGPPHMFPKGQTKKEARLAEQYRKLGSIWCWRFVDSEDSHFESFNISNQKIIKRKSEKSGEARSRIMLGREKKLPGEIMVDLNQFRGCCMTTVGGKSQFYQLEIKQELFDGNLNSFVFANSVNGGGGNW